MSRYSHGMSRSPEYQAWADMNGRCNNPSNKFFNCYGGRGISVCDSWMSGFISFFEDMGLRPSKTHSLDRIDVNGNYTKENCRWATRTVQDRNTRLCAKIDFEGEIHSYESLSKKLNLPRELIRGRIVSGYSLEEAISMPINHHLMGVVRKVYQHKGPRIPKRSGYPGVGYDSRNKYKKWYVRDKEKRGDYMFFEDLADAIEAAKKLGWIKL